MDIKQFMIDDWVMDSDINEYTQVTYDMMYESYEWDAVSLNEHLLDINGWDIQETFLRAKYATHPLIYGIKLKIDNSGLRALTQQGDYICEILYVHKLQQLLRLIGFEELANKFSLKE